MEPIERLTFAARCLLMAVCLFTIVSCQTAPKAGFCAVSEPIRLSQATIAAMSDAEVEKALEQNKLGQRLCHWVP